MRSLCATCQYCDEDWFNRKGQIVLEQYCAACKPGFPVAQECSGYVPVEDDLLEEER